MLTIFTTCRPFDYKEFDIIQRNAIESWLQLDPKPKVILMGKDNGSKDIANEYGIEYCEDIMYSEAGTPRFDSMVAKAESLSNDPYMLHVSCDIVVFQDTMEALESIQDSDLTEFCAVCQKSRQYKIIRLDFDDEDWEELAKRNIKLAAITSGDYYMYSRGFWSDTDMPAFYVGRCACDSWLFYTASQKGKMIDLTKAITIIDYSHDYDYSDRESRSKEVAHNRALAGKNKLHIDSANYIMDPNFRIHKAR